MFANIILSIGYCGKSSNGLLFIIFILLTILNFLNYIKCIYHSISKSLKIYLLRCISSSAILSYTIIPTNADSKL